MDFIIFLLFIPLYVAVAPFKLAQFIWYESKKSIALVKAAHRSFVFAILLILLNVVLSPFYMVTVTWRGIKGQYGYYKFRKMVKKDPILGMLMGIGMLSRSRAS